MDFNYAPAIVGEDRLSGESNLEKVIMMDNLTVESSVPLRHTSLTIVILLTAYLSVLVVGLVGNVVVIVVVPKMQKMKTATKYFILNLAIADLLVLLFCLLPNLISNIYVPWVMGWFMCKAVPYIQGVSVCASVYSLAAISADRLMAIRSPSRRQVTKSLARKIIVLIWMWAAGLALPWLIYFDLSNADGRGPSLVFCIENWPPGMNGNTYFVLVNLGLCYLFPLAFISFCHLSIWLRVRRRQVPGNASASPRQLAHKRTKDSVQRLVIVVVVGFASCWLPLYVICIRVKLIPKALGSTEEKVLDYALPIAQWLGAANSCINPILYVFFNDNFRFSLRRILRGFSARNTRRNGPNPSYSNHQNQRTGLRQNLVRLNMALHRSRPKNSQLKQSRGNGVDAEESNVVVMSHQNNPKCATITRSQTYEAAMENPW